MSWADAFSICMLAAKTLTSFFCFSFPSILPPFLAYLFWGIPSFPSNRLARRGPVSVSSSFFWRYKSFFLSCNILPPPRLEPPHSSHLVHLDLVLPAYPLPLFFFSGLPSPFRFLKTRYCTCALFSLYFSFDANSFPVHVPTFLKINVPVLPHHLRDETMFARFFFPQVFDARKSLFLLPFSSFFPFPFSFRRREHLVFA